MISLLLFYHSIALCSSKRGISAIIIVAFIWYIELRKGTCTSINQNGLRIMHQASYRTARRDGNKERE